MANSLLNYQFHQVKQTINSSTLVFIHGLFGDMNNLGIIARAFSENYNILRVDLRNHGHSFHSEKMNYQLMAEDVIAVIRHLNLSKVILIGHSMGGKTAMKITALCPDLGIDHIPDPWYTKNFQQTYALLDQCCDALLTKIRQKHHL